MNRKELIAEMADDITSGIRRYLSMADIVDCMMDQGTLDPDTVAGMLSCNEDVRIDCRYRLVKEVEDYAIDFFTNNTYGIEFIDNKLAEIAAEEDEAAKERMQA
jgi:hypothetical protein